MDSPPTGESRRSKPEGFLQILLQRTLPFVVFAALWLMFITHLSQYWPTCPQYTFGWFLPFLYAYFFLMRRKSRPATRPRRSAAATSALRPFKEEQSQQPRCVFSNASPGRRSHSLQPPNNSSCIRTRCSLVADKNFVLN